MIEQGPSGLSSQVVMHREAPFFLIAHSVVFQPMRKEVQDFKISPFGLTPFYGVSLDK